MYVPRGTAQLQRPCHHIGHYHFLFPFVLISALLLAFYHSNSGKPSFSKYSIIKRNVAQFNVETVNVPKIIICLCLKDMMYCCFPQRFKTSCCAPVSSLRSSGGPWHTV